MPARRRPYPAVFVPHRPTDHDYSARHANGGEVLPPPRDPQEVPREDGEDGGEVTDAPSAPGNGDDAPPQNDVAN